MPTQEFETEIAVKIALLEQSDIARLRSVTELATQVSAMAVDKVPGVLVDVLHRQLSHFLDKVLGLRSLSEPLPDGESMVSSHPNLRSADATAVVQSLLGFTTSSVLTEPDKMRPTEFDQLKMLLGRLCELVESVHEVRELSDFGWQWNDFNGGWDSGLCNSEYELSLVWRALRSHNADWLPPKDPAGSGHMADFITYWFSLSAVVLGHLAWSNPSLGMARWVNSGMPGDDGVLSGLKRLYGADTAGVILNAHVPQLAQSMPAMALGRRGLNTVAFDPSASLSENPNIAKAVEKSRRWSAMLCGGTDALHLREHLRVLLFEPGPQKVRLSGGHDGACAPNVQLLLPHAYGWHESLQRSGDRLPTRPDGRSWRVDVTSATLGYLGEFRRSRETGRWFAGKHSSHMLGN